ncbi:MAG: hypothetical protein IJW23_00820 [Lentisphaeria bacterium]|nr:hypothetical protein [Lentisphaeria bacterium]
MKKVLLFLFVTGAVLFSGCVSTDRMSRMSGGVFGEYSAPPKYRLRSEKFLKKTPHHADSSKRSNKTEIAGLDDTLINVWPFYFRNAAYWSILWPFIDCDDYGFAIRPFYVKDGDEQSFLFPLSAWNAENKDGWVANFVWGDGQFGFIPLTWHATKKDTGWFYYTPLLIHSYDRRPFKLNDYTRSRQFGAFNFRNRDDYFTLFMLGYKSKHTLLDTGKWDWLYHYYRDVPNSVLAYHFAKIGKPVPKNGKELWKFRSEIFKTLQQKEGYSFGFFPLFHYKKYAGGGSTGTFLLLNGYEKTKNLYKWAFFAPLLSYESNELRKTPWATASDEFFSLPLMTKITTNKSYANEGAIKILRQLYQLDKNIQFKQNLPKIKGLLKQLDPNLKMPVTVVDYKTLDLFLKEWAADKNFPVEYTYEGGCLPLFLYKIRKNYRSYAFPALLTGYEQIGNSKSFFSLPILTFMNKEENSEYLRIAPPFIYMDSLKRNKNAHTKRVHSHTTKMAKTWDVVEEKDIYAACGLFYRGKVAFHVAKKQFKSGDVEFLRENLLEQFYTSQSIQRSWANYNAEMKRTAAWLPKDKIDYYRKCIREEELKIRAEQIRKLERDLAAKWNLVLQTAARLNFKVTKADIASEKAVTAAVNRLLKDYTELRWKEYIGNGIFFRKENFYNGDYNWRLLWFLASGEKEGAKESTNVLHLLYRYRRDGVRSERLFFPFVSIVKDGADSKFSFLWRVFQLKEEKGKHSGYFMFIPF